MPTLTGAGAVVQPVETTAAATPAGEPIPAPPPPPGSLPSVPGLAILVRLGDSTTPVDPAASETIVDPSVTFEVRVPVPLRGARLVLIDSRDSMLDAESTTEVSATSSTFALVPLEAMTPGSKLVLRLEGSENQLVRTPDGRTFEPLSLPVKVAGTPPPPPPRKQAKQSKKKRAR